MLRTIYLLFIGTSREPLLIKASQTRRNSEFMENPSRGLRPWDCRSPINRASLMGEQMHTKRLRIECACAHNRRA